MKRHLLPILFLLLAASFHAIGGTTTAEVGATKIHGGGYKCDSFEGDYGRNAYDASATGSSKEQVLQYAILASSAYLDRDDGADVMNNGQGRSENWKLLGENNVSEVSIDDVKKYLGGDEGLAKAGLRVETQTLRANETSVGKNATGKDYKNTDKYPTSSDWKDVSAVTVSGSDPDKLNVRFFMQSDGTLVLSFRGTAGVSDIRDDAKQATHFGPIPQQYKDAAKVLENVLANYPGKVVCTGHSLGGGLVQYAMASNDLQGRVDGYVYNSAGLNGLQTVNTFDTDKAIDAAAHIVGVRSDGDPVSFVGYHLLKEGKMYEVATETFGGSEHSIKNLILNMAASMPSSTLTDKLVTSADRQDAVQGQADRNQRTKDREAQYAAAAAQKGPPTTSSTFPPSLGNYIGDQISSNPDVQKAFDDLFDKVRIGLDTVLDASTAQKIADKLEELAKKGAIAAGNAVDKAVQAEIDKIKAEIVSLMPGDSSKAQMDKLLNDVLAGVGAGDFSAAIGDLPDFGASLAGDYASKLIDGLNLPADEKAALKKTVSDAVQAYINGTGVGASIQGNIEKYIYSKIQSQFGTEVADAWKKAYLTWQGGANPWADIKAAATKTIETWAFDKLEKAIDSQLSKLLKKHPVLAEVFRALGIDSSSIVGSLKNIWGVLTGPGTFKDKLQSICKLAVQGLANMLKSLLHWGIGKIQALLNGLMTKIGKIISGWIQKLLGNTFHLSQSLVNKAMKAVNAAIGSATKVVVSLPSKIEPVIGKAIDAGANEVLKSVDDFFSSPSTLSPPTPAPTIP